MSWGVRHLSRTRHVGPLAGLHKDLSRSLPLAGFHDLEGNGLEHPMGIKTKRGTDIGHHLQPSCSANVAFDGDPASQVRAEDFAFPQSTPRCRTVNKAMRCQASIASSLWMNPPEVPPGAKWPVDADHTDKAPMDVPCFLKSPRSLPVCSMDSVRIARSSPPTSGSCPWPPCPRLHSGGSALESERLESSICTFSSGLWIGSEKPAKRSGTAPVL